MSIDRATRITVLRGEGFVGSRLTQLAWHSGEFQAGKRWVLCRVSWRFCGAGGQTLPDWTI